jgi:hypothetical protein
MPEHIHLLVSEPEKGSVSLMMQVLKQRVARRVLTKVRKGVEQAAPTLSQRTRKDGAPSRKDWPPTVLVNSMKSKAWATRPLRPIDNADTATNTLSLLRNEFAGLDIMASVVLRW